MKPFENFINELTKALSGVEQQAAGGKEFLRTLIAGQASKLDLVSREEFDAQAELLRASEAKLGALEAKLDELANASSSTTKE